MAEADDLRQFIRDMNTRADKRTDAMIRHLDALTAEIREQRMEMRVEMREGRAALRDMRAEIRANTAGLLRVLDELRGSA